LMIFFYSFIIIDFFFWFSQLFIGGFGIEKYDGCVRLGWRES